MSKLNKLVLCIIMFLPCIIEGRFLEDLDLEVNAQIISTAYLKVSKEMSVTINPGYDDLDVEIFTSKGHVKAFCNNKSGQIVILTAENGYYDGRDFLLIEQTDSNPHQMRFLMESNKEPDGTKKGNNWYRLGNNEKLIDTIDNDAPAQVRHIRAVIYPGEARNKPFGLYLAKMILSQYTVD